MSSIAYMADLPGSVGEVRRRRAVLVLLPEMDVARQVYLLAIHRIARDLGEQGEQILRDEGEAVRAAVHGIADILCQEDPE